MKWFGPPWKAGVCETGQQVSTPSKPCFACQEPIRHGDRGVVLPFAAATKEEDREVPYHLGCLIASIFPNSEPKPSK